MKYLFQIHKQKVQQLESFDIYYAIVWLIGYPPPPFWLFQSYYGETLNARNTRYIVQMKIKNIQQNINQCYLSLYGHKYSVIHDAYLVSLSNTCRFLIGSPSASSPAQVLNGDRCQEFMQFNKSLTLDLWRWL
jgi:hypothetical protein